MIEDLIRRVFCTRNAAHIAHWKTKSYSEHQSLGAFYDAAIDSLDKLVEAHQGIMGRVDVGTIETQKPTKDIIILLMEDLAWISQNRKDITDKMPVLDNLLQDLESVYASTLYKLKNLS